MRSACPTNSAADAAGPAPGQAQRPGPALALWQAARPVVTGRAAHRELGVAQCPLPPLCSPGSLGKSATYMLTSLLLRAPVRFMAKKAGAKMRLLPDPVAQIDRRSCRWCVITAAGTLRSINDRGCCWPAGC